MKRGDKAGNHSANPFPVLGLRPGRFDSKPKGRLFAPFRRARAGLTGASAPQRRRCARGSISVLPGALPIQAMPCAIRLSASFGGLARRLTRQRRFSFDDFGPIESGAATAVMRHTLARGVENTLARFRVSREGREGDALNDGEMRALATVASPAFPIPLRRS